jgi:hypothetical protein
MILSNLDLGNEPTLKPVCVPVGASRASTSRGRAAPAGSRRQKSSGNGISRSSCRDPAWQSDRREAMAWSYGGTKGRPPRRQPGGRTGVLVRATAGVGWAYLACRAMRIRTRGGRSRDSQQPDRPSAYSRI